jgi:hypothetical protein
VERGGSVRQYLIRGEGAGKWGDGEVAERARLDSVSSLVGSSGGRCRVSTSPAAQCEGGEAEERFS